MGEVIRIHVSQGKKHRPRIPSANDLFHGADRARQNLSRASCRFWITLDHQMTREFRVTARWVPFENGASDGLRARKPRKFRRQQMSIRGSLLPSAWPCCVRSVCANDGMWLADHSRSRPPESLAPCIAFRKEDTARQRARVPRPEYCLMMDASRATPRVLVISQSREESLISCAHCAWAPCLP